MSIFLRPLAALYHQVVEFKNSLYDRGVIDVYRAPVPVISIGNLTVGGTGKTPITDFLLKNLAQEKKVAVVSRSYQADVEQPSLVDVEHPHAARYYGDEPVLLAQNNPQVDIYVGPSKWRTAAFACSQDRYDLLIVDDGFQHRKLHRDLNIVVLDATEKIENYQVLPQGRAREAWHSLQRADVIVISKSNLASEEELGILEKRLPDNKEKIYLGYEIRSLRNVKTGEVMSLRELGGHSAMLVSAIARPDVFEQMMGSACQISKKSLYYRDHHQYRAVDIREILADFAKSGAQYLVTTEKDAVKLRSLLPEDSLLWSASLEVVEISRKGLLYEKVRALLG